MRNLLLVGILGLLIGCGKTETIKEQNTVIESKVQESLDGVYYIDNSAVEVNQDVYGRISIVMLDYLTSTNPFNGTLGEHPKTNVSKLYLTQGNKILYSNNVNYGNGDLEYDTSSQDIIGQKRTDFEYKFKNDKLYLTIKIYNNTKYNNVNSVIAKRTFVGVK